MNCKLKDFIDRQKTLKDIELTPAQINLLTPIVFDSQKTNEIRKIYRQSVQKEGRYYIAHPFRFSYLTVYKKRVFMCTNKYHLQEWQDFLWVQYKIKIDFSTWKVNKYEEEVFEKNIKYYYKPVKEVYNELIKTYIERDNKCLGWFALETIKFKNI